MIYFNKIGDFFFNSTKPSKMIHFTCLIVVISIHMALHMDLLLTHSEHFQVLIEAAQFISY